ncbi:MAG: insulinase family protein [Candidatus Eisenbacteria bacterium]|nr:insulinase family protein [Candidatus Eisenbacteria bacterium]
MRFASVVPLAPAATLAAPPLPACVLPLALAVALVAPLPLAGPAVAASAPAFRVPIPQVRTLPNGLQVAVFPNPRLPIVQMQLLVPAGTAEEPADQPGVANAAVQLLRQGTTSRTGAQFAADVDRLGGNISANSSRDFSTVSGAFLSADFDAGLELLADAVVNPIFPESEIERFKAQTRDVFGQMRQSPGALAEEHLWALALAGHPYARPLLGTQEFVEQLARDHLRAFHRDHYRPDRAVLAIAGDVTPERAFAAAEERFGGWAGHAVATSAVPAPPRLAGLRIRIVDRPGQSQTEVRLGLPVPPRASPDQLPLQIANYLLGGGGFSSRLTQAMRVDDGLSYDARSALVTLRDGGVLALSALTRGDSVAIVVGRMRAELQRMVEHPPEEAEVARARRSFQGVFPLQFETLGALIAQWMAAVSYGLPADYLESYRERVGAVTAEQVAAAARRWLSADRLAIVAVGPAAELKPRLEPLGPVEVLASGLPAVAVDTARAGPPTADQVRRGRELVAQALAAHGGAARLRRVKDSTVNGDMTIRMQGREVSGQLEQVRKEPWKMKYATHFLAFDTQQILNGRRAWSRFSGDSVRVSEMDSLSTEALRTGFSSDVVHVLLAAAEVGAAVAARGTDLVDGHETDVVEVVAPGRETRRLHLDAATHRLVALDQSEDPVGHGLAVRRIYRDHRTVNGVLWPFHEERMLGGVRVMTLLVRSVTVDSGVDDALFQRPPDSAKATAPRR